MSGSPVPRATAASSIVTTALLVLCLLGAAVAAVASVVAGIQGPTVPPASAVPQKGQSGVLFEAMVKVHGFSTPPVFNGKPDDSAGIAAAILAIVVFGLIGLVVWRLLQRRPFGRAITVATIAAGLAVAVAAGILGTARGDTDIPTAEFIFAGALLVIVGAIGNQAAHLQRETEGLV
jgi:hypothetical protein